jgi:hypothetical protein
MIRRFLQSFRTRRAVTRARPAFIDAYRSVLVAKASGDCRSLGDAYRKARARKTALLAAELGRRA